MNGLYRFLLGDRANSVPEDASLDLVWLHAPQSWHLFVFLGVLLGGFRILLCLLALFPESLVFRARILLPVFVGSAVEGVFLASEGSDCQPAGVIDHQGEPA